MRRIHKEEKVKKNYNKEEWERKMRLPETNYKIWYGEDEEELGLKLKESKRKGSKEGRNLKRRKKNLKPNYLLSSSLHGKTLVHERKPYAKASESP